MKKILLIPIFFIAFQLHAQVVYTPQNNYQYMYWKADSGMAAPFRDTTLGRGTTRPGSIVCRPADSTLYTWSGKKWVLVNPSISGFITALNGKVDSLTLTGNILFFWKNGVAFGLTLPNTRNIYNQSDTLTSDRIVEGANRDLYMIGIKELRLNGKVFTVNVGSFDGAFYVDTALTMVRNLKSSMTLDIDGLHINTQHPFQPGKFYLNIDSIGTIPRNKYSIPYIADSTNGETRLGSPSFISTIIKPYTSPAALNEIVGTGAGPTSGISTYTDTRLIGLGSNIQISINGILIYNYGTYSSFTFNSGTGQIDISPNVWTTGNTLTIFLNQ